MHDDEHTPRWRRLLRPPPKDDPPSVTLLAAIGVLQQLDAGARLSALDALAHESGIAAVDLWRLIESGITAGYIDVDDDDAISLTDKGWRWWRRRYEGR